ncbi:MAG: hypothetical protein KAU91_06810 [Candidatus Aminicenantes bacterium]|nr:hypothetical protein [Candidatus Aminicenantes bacterium]
MNQNSVILSFIHWSHFFVSRWLILLHPIVLQLANTFVEIINGLDVQRRVTDNKGRFCFEDLCPGRWTLRVYDTNMPEFHYLEKETFEFELKAGDKKEIEVRVLPRSRPIRIIEKGGEVI